MMLAAGCLGGIGFTMSLFIAGLALTPDHLDAGKVGIMIGSVISAAAGSGLLVLGILGNRRQGTARPADTRTSS
jgi:NhaA family Na+:H+ antiporter